jgi:PAN domain
MGLEQAALYAEYKQLLIEYNTLVATVNSSLGSSPSNNTSTSFVILDNMQYTNNTSSNIVQVSTVDDCKSKCQELTNCTGATFYSSTGNCSLVNGAGVLLPITTSSSTPDTYAIVSSVTSLLQELQSTSDALYRKGGEILLAINQNGVGGGGGGKKVTSLFPSESNVQSQVLADQTAISRTQFEINNLLDSYNQTNEQYQISVLEMDMQSANYDMWKVIAAIVVLITVTLMYNVLSNLD